MQDAADRSEAWWRASNRSTRSMDRLAKVARTVADLAASDEVRPAHVDKAATFVVGGLLREMF